MQRCCDFRMIRPLVNAISVAEANSYRSVKKVYFRCKYGTPSTPSFRSVPKNRWSSKRCSFATITSPLTSPSLDQATLASDKLVDDETATLFTNNLLSTTSRNNHLTQQYSHQCGHGKIVALSLPSTSPSSPISTHLTELRHSSPMRLVPSRRTHPPHLSHNPTQQNYEAALLHLSSYGGGLVPGDSLRLDIDVRGNGAVLCILTQGGQRIYRPGERFRMPTSYFHGEVASISQNDVQNHRNNGFGPSSKLCQSTIQCVVEPGSTLLYLPDPTVPYYQSSFGERREFTCQYDGASMGSIIAVDWYSCGRLFSAGMEAERWAFEYLSTRTDFFVVEKGPLHHPMQNTRPDLIESVIFDNKVSKSKDSTIPTSAATAFGKNFNSMATLLLHGPNSITVANRAKILSRKFISGHTRVRTELTFGDEIQDVEVENEELDKLLVSLGGRVMFSITPIEKSKGQFSQQTHMVRILAESNEDIYRVLHYCLKPCSQYLGGLEPYQERIHSSRTVAKRSHVVNRHRQDTEVKQSRRESPTKPNLNSIANHLIFGNEKPDISFKGDAWFRLCTLSDSALPVGSFAHSLGVEAASQMKLFTNEGSIDEKQKKLTETSWSMSNSASSVSEEALADYIHAVSCSHARFSTPLVLAGYSLLVPKSSVDSVDIQQIHQSWYDIDAYVDTLLVCNEPGRQASRDQGLGLLRIVPSFPESTFYHHNDMEPRCNKVSELWERIRRSIDTKMSYSSSPYDSPQQLAYGHAAPIYGILSASLGISPMDSCRVFAFGAARDSVSAAVRLNLIGPTAGLSILDGVGRVAVEKGLAEGLLGMISENMIHGGSSNDELLLEEETRETQLERWLRSVATCAPLMDTVQPVHDLLSLRLFKT